MVAQDSDITEDTIRSWWMKICGEDLAGYMSKRKEYGSVDLEIIGQTVSTIVPKGVDATEAGIAFYLLGKVARMWGAYAVGKMPSNDTIHDIVVYAMMARMRRAGLL